MNMPVHVAAAVITNAQGEVLISLRHSQAHQGGLWEFPGGKVEAGEDAYTALCRELHEELGVNVISARPLIRIPHHYPDKSVLLDVWQVSAFSGEAHGREGQPLQWVAPARLNEFEFPAANHPIVSAVRLPQQYLITPEPGADFLLLLEEAFKAGIRLLQLRAKQLDAQAYSALAHAVCDCAKSYGAQVLLNTDSVALVEATGAGLQLNSHQLMQLTQRPLAAQQWLAASCHNAQELRQAERIGCDFALLSPVLPTASHPGAAHLGWSNFQALTENCCLPVYALGGMTADDLDQAWRSGAQGIAAIRGLWPEPL